MPRQSAAVRPSPMSTANSHSSSKSERSSALSTGSSPPASASRLRAVTWHSAFPASSFKEARWSRSNENRPMCQSSLVSGMVVCNRMRIGFFIVCSPLLGALAVENLLPVLLFRPGLVGVPADLGIVSAEQSGIDAVADTLEPLIHLGHVLAHFADVLDGNLEIFDWLPDDPRKNLRNLASGQVVRRQLNSLADAPPLVLQCQDCEPGHAVDRGLGQ